MSCTHQPHILSIHTIGPHRLRYLEIDGHRWWHCGDWARVAGYTQAQHLINRLGDDEIGREVVETGHGQHRLRLASDAGIRRIVQRLHRRFPDEIVAWASATVAKQITLPEIIDGAFAPVVQVIGKAVAVHTTSRAATRGDNAVTPFEFDGEEVRIVLQDGEPWWVLSDVARVLGFSHAPHAARLLRDHQKGVRSVDTLGGQQSVTVISEGGLNRLVLRSRRPDAGRFQDWVTDEVLPTIRRTGAYTTPASAGFTIPKTMSEALRLAADQLERAEAAEARVLALEPPAQAWAVLAETERDYSFSEAAKMLARGGIETGRNRLFRQLADLGMIYRTGGSPETGRPRWEPYQEHVDAGRLRLRIGSSFENPKTGEIEASVPQVRISAKGLEYILHRLGGGSVA